MTDKFDNTIAERDKKAAYDAIDVISFKEFEAIVNKWLLVVDPSVVKLLVATIFANLFPSDPVWLFLVAPSSGGKTELLNMFLKYPQCYFLSQLTPNTFLSGYKAKDKEPSLLHQLGTNKTLIFKDFTSLLEGNKDAFKELMGQLREIFDGYVTKRLGTGDEITWKGKLGFIAGCTTVLEYRMNLIGAMGERFLTYYIKQPKRAALRIKMKENVGKEEEMRNEIQDGLIGCMKGLLVPEKLPELPEEVSKTIDSLTDFIAIGRAVVMRAFDTKKEIEGTIEPEGAGRTYKQLYTVALALFHIGGGEWTDQDSYAIRKLAICSVHSTRYKLIKTIASYKTDVKTATLSIALGLPTSTTRRYLEDLAAISMDDGEIRILTRNHQGKGKPDLWQITPAMRDILASMGDDVEPTKEDADFDITEEDVPVGVSGNGKPHEDDRTEEVEALIGSIDPAELDRLGI